MLSVQTHWNPSGISPAQMGKENTLPFLTHGIPHLLFLNHETAELQCQPHLSVPHRKANAVTGKDSAACNMEQDPKIAHRIDRNSQKGKCAVESRREGGSTQASPTSSCQYMEWCIRLRRAMTQFPSRDPFSHRKSSYKLICHRLRASVSEIWALL